MASTTFEFLAHDEKHYKLWMTALSTVVKCVHSRIYAHAHILWVVICVAFVYSGAFLSALNF